MTQWDEKRKGRRLPIEAAVAMAVVSRPLGFLVWRPQFRGTVRDASVGGVKLLTERSIPVGAAVKLWIQVQTGGRIQTLKLCGDIVQSRPDDATGSFLMRVRLRDRPKKSMRIWTDTMLEEIRYYDS